MPFQIKPLYKHTFKVLHCTIYFSVPKPTYKTSERSIKTPLPKSGDKDDDGNRDSDKQKTIPSLKNNDDNDNGDETNKQDTLLSSKTSKQVIIESSQ